MIHQLTNNNLFIHTLFFSLGGYITIEQNNEQLV